MIEKGCDIGARVIIGSGSVVRSYTILCDDVKIGKNCKIGPFVLIQPGVVVGDNCKIHSHSFLCEGVTLEDEVFVGHGVMFCNEKYPRAIRNAAWELKDDGRVLVKKGAVIGSGAVILPGVTIGSGAIVGAGAVVTKGVGFKEIVVGNPAVLIDQIRKIYGGLMFVREHEAQMEALRRIVDGKKK